LGKPTFLKGLCAGTNRIKKGHCLPIGQAARRSKPSGRERWLGVLILSLLALVAAWVILRQFSFNPAVEAARHLRQSGFSPAAGGAAQEGKESLASLAPPQMLAASPLELYQPGNLYEKINGKADLYLRAGFQSLRSQRFAIKDDPNLWAEVFWYQMGDSSGAYAVFSQQRRPGALKLDLAPNAYQARNLVVLAHGPHYLEMVASQVSTKLSALLVQMARAFVSHHPQEKSTAPELAWFPGEGLVKESIALQTSGAFGFERMQGIYIARYRLGPEEAALFVSRRASAEQAAGLAKEYYDFLLANGGKALPQNPELGGQARLVDMLGMYEVIMLKGPVLAGVHEATSLQTALDLAKRLEERLKEAGP
jgi:hypothetical protein